MGTVDLEAPGPPSEAIRRVTRLLWSALICLGLPVSNAAAQQRQTRTVVLIVSDGLRWQEVFGGADTALIASRQGVGDTAALRRDFARPTVERSRLELMPFLWSVVARQGQIYGNRALGSDAAVGTKNTARGIALEDSGYQAAALFSAPASLHSSDSRPCSPVRSCRADREDICGHPTRSPIWPGS